MLTLRLLGTPHLEGANGVLPNPGPRRVAMLASIAAAGTAGITRDKLVARLWPDADDDRARRNLSQLLYSLRTELGVDLIEGTSTLRLDPAQCTADVMAFDLAIAETDWRGNYILSSQVWSTAAGGTETKAPSEDGASSNPAGAAKPGRPSWAETSTLLSCHQWPFPMKALTYRRPFGLTTAHTTVFGSSVTVPR